SSFFSIIQNCFVNSVMGVGISGFGTALQNRGGGCGIGLWWYAGNLVDGFDYQPGPDAYICTLIGSGLGGVSELTQVTGCTNDAEVWNFRRMQAVGACFGQGGGSRLFQSNYWDATLSAAPPFGYYSTPDLDSVSTHLNDTFRASFFQSGHLGPSPVETIQFIG